jgi:collagenase-like PrtC family protease
MRGGAAVLRRAPNSVEEEERENEEQEQEEEEEAIWEIKGRHLQTQFEVGHSSTL